MNILKTSLLYSFSALGLSAVAFSYYVFLPKYYVDTLGVSAFWFGIIVILTRIADAIFDPLIGRLVDRFPDFQRKLIVLVALPLGVSFIALTNPPQLISPLLWFLLFSIFFYISWSCFSVPYQTLGLSLDSDTNQRTKILGTREGFLLLGTVIASLFPVLFQKINLKPSDDFSYLFWAGLVYAIILLTGALICYYLLPDSKFVISNKERVKSQSLKSLWQYSGFKNLLITYALTSFGSTLSGAMILFYIDHVLASKLGNQFIFLYFLGVLIFMPFWIYWTKKVGKLKAWLQSLSLSTGSFLAVLFLGSGDEYYYLLIIILSSFGLGGAIIVPASLQADVAEKCSKESQQNLAAQMIGYWSLAKKLSAAIAAGCAFPILELIGYQAGIVQSSIVNNGLIILYAGIPATCYLVAIYFAYGFKNE